MTDPAALIRGIPTPFVLSLRFVDVGVRVLTNDPDVWASLGHHFEPWVTPGDTGPRAVVTLIQGDPRAGDDGVVRRTGVLMALAPRQAVAVGDLRANLNQAINLVNACFARTVVDRGYVLLHASAVARGDHVVALAGVPGAGKSTAARHLVEAGFHFVSNDRLLVRSLAEGVDAIGYPKQPRGTLGTRKGDVDFDAPYGRGTVVLRGWLRSLVLLRWTLSGEGFRARPLTSDAALAYLDLFALDRHPGAPADPTAPIGHASLLQHVRIFDVTGRPDFSALVSLVRELVP